MGGVELRGLKRSDSVQMEGGNARESNVCRMQSHDGVSQWW